MKKLYFLLLLFSGTVSAQIVNIPDANFKAKLLSANANNNTAYDNNGNQIIVDVNGDGEIQNSEALIVYRLNVDGSSISNLDGVSSFINLKILNCQLNELTSLDVNNLVNLQYLNCSYNYFLTTLDLNNLTAILSVNSESCYLTSITINPAAHIEELIVTENQLISLNVSSLMFLKSLYCGYNQLSSLPIDNLINLETLVCYHNQITSLNINNLVNLHSLQCFDNLLTTLDVSGNTFLYYLSCQNNLLTTFDLSAMGNLVNSLSIGNPGFQQLDYNSLPNLYAFGFYGGIQTSISLNNLVNLHRVTFENTNLTSIDISGNHQLTSVNCLNNTDLLIFNMKCGSTPNYQIRYCQNIQFICADESLLTDMQNGINMSLNNPNVVINSYCSFTPGGVYNTITGTITLDANNNGCDANDVLQPNISVSINNGNNTGACFTNSAANYTFYTQTGNFVVTPAVENPTWFIFSPSTATISFTNINNNVTTQNFCITANGIHPDVEVILAPVLPARPGFDAVYKLVYKNKGNQTLSGNVTLAYDDSVLDYVSTTEVFSAQSAGLLTWSYANLLPFENRGFYVTFHVNAPTDIPAVNIGDVLHFTTVVNPIVGDEFPVDNTFQYNQTVVGSFDPNDITCLEGAVIPPSEIGNYLHYIINFENTGTAEAENIVVKEVINTTKYDLSSLQILNSSHPVNAKLTNNVAEFIFKNINLDSGGHGNILLKIKSKNTLVQGNMVSKNANIYFDYNFPVATNNANTVFQSLNTPDFPKDASVSVYPNPVKDTVAITSQFAVKSVELYDVQGRLLQTQLTKETRTVLDMSTQIKGVYFVKITTEKGIKVEKVVKE